MNVSAFSVITLVTVMLLKGNGSSAQYNEKYRPQFHYTAPSGWVGDPCALVHYRGTYHLFTWGHAVSKDLVHWEQLPFPMKGDDGSFNYFTGSMVVDKNNTAGFGANSMIACYAMNNKRTRIQAQGISYSNDYVTFTYFNGNPVLDIGSKEFRDPQVFWYAPDKKWIMVVALAVDRKVAFYASADLKSWTHLSDFGQIGSQDGVWECPDFIELPVDGNADAKKWFLSVAVGPNKQQYFLGDFDGTRFKLDPKIEAFLRRGEGMDGSVFEDFNTDLYAKGWVATGTAFGLGPNQTNSTVHLGKGFVNSRASAKTHVGATGTLTSPPFKIGRSAINFLIAGGNFPQRTCVNLLIKNRVVRSTTGDSTDVMKWAGWNVTDLIGQRAQIQIVDNDTGAMGHVQVDHIMFSDILHNDNREHALWSEYGCDYYAAKSCRDFDNSGGRITWLGWMSNWQYANKVPTWGGGNNRGMESISRVLGLKTFKEGLRLTQQPIPEMETLRKGLVSFSKRTITNGCATLEDFKPEKNTYEIEAVFNANTKAVFGLNVCVGSGRKLGIAYDPVTSNLYVDRTNCSDYTADPVFNKTFPRILNVPVRPENGQLRMRLFVDQSSIELFANDGSVAVTALTYPSEKQTGIQIFSEKGQAVLLSFKAWALESIWHSTSGTAIRK